VGSFDEAIREHLDLKRRGGASPREVENMEREAFSVEPSPERAARPFDRDAIAAYDARAGSKNASQIKVRRDQLSQETVEIDMATIIEAHRIDGPNERHAYDWNAEKRVPDIGDPASEFDWETPERTRVHDAA
jgi:hypothetical protein